MRDKSTTGRQEDLRYSLKRNNEDRKYSLKEDNEDRRYSLKRDDEDRRSNLKRGNENLRSEFKRDNENDDLRETILKKRREKLDESKTSVNKPLVKLEHLGDEDLGESPKKKTCAAVEKNQVSKRDKPESNRIEGKRLIPKIKENITKEHPKEVSFDAKKNNLLIQEETDSSGDTSDNDSVDSELRIISELLKDYKDLSEECSTDPESEDQRSKKKKKKQKKKKNKREESEDLLEDYCKRKKKKKVKDKNGKSKKKKYKDEEKHKVKKDKKNKSKANNVKICDYSETESSATDIECRKSEPDKKKKEKEVLTTKLKESRESSLTLSEAKVSKSNTPSTDVHSETRKLKDAYNKTYDSELDSESERALKKAKHYHKKEIQDGDRKYERRGEDTSSQEYKYVHDHREEKYSINRRNADSKSEHHRRGRSPRMLEDRETKPNYHLRRQKSSSIPESEERRRDYYHKREHSPELKGRNYDEKLYINDGKIKYDRISRDEKQSEYTIRVPTHINYQKRQKSPSVPETEERKRYNNHRREHSFYIKSGKYDDESYSQGKPKCDKSPEDDKQREHRILNGLSKKRIAEKRDSRCLDYGDKLETAFVGDEKHCRDDAKNTSNKYKEDPVKEWKRSTQEINLLHQEEKRSSNSNLHESRNKTSSNKSGSSWTVELDEFIEKQKSKILGNKKIVVQVCCDFCGLSDHPSPDCKENEMAGSNPPGPNGKKIFCTQCGSFSHVVNHCFHTEEKGSNPYGVDGRKLSCTFCKSYNHKTNDCGKVHSSKYGRNKYGISGMKLSCSECNSYDHLGTECHKFMEKNKSTTKNACEHCGSFNHDAEYCKELAKRVVRRVNTPTDLVLNTTTDLNNDNVKITFSLLPLELNKSPCPTCRSIIHGEINCPLKHMLPYGKNPCNEFGEMKDCSQCGSFKHLLENCLESEKNGRNMIGHDGKKLNCIYCGSYNHLLKCIDIDLEKNGRNLVDPVTKKKTRCDYCGSFDHRIDRCLHSHQHGRNSQGVNGRKERCPYCGSFGHKDPWVCGGLCDQTREFLRLRLGGPSAISSGVVGTSNCWSSTVGRKTRWDEKGSVKFVDLSVNRDSLMKEPEINQEEKDEQMDAERKMKERLMMKFKVIDPRFFGSLNEDSFSKESEDMNISKEKDDSENKVGGVFTRDTTQIEVYGEEVGLDQVYDEPDKSVFEDIEMRAEEKRTYLMRITPIMHNDIVTILEGETEEVITAFNINITKHDMFCLTGNNWLNDKLIEFYLQMIASRSINDFVKWEMNMPKVHCMSTYFFLNLIMRGYGPSLERWTKDVDIFLFDIVLVPIHLDMHWCIAIIDFRSPGVFYYDPMGGHNMPALSAILEYLRMEHKNKRGSELDLRTYAKEIVTDCPQQSNGSDCGLFICKIADFLSRDVPLTFSQEDMPYYRKRMIWEIAHNTLVSP